MLKDQYLSKFDNLLSANRLLKFALIVMLIWNFYNWEMARHMQAQTQTIIVPLGSEGMEIQHDKIGERYARRMARYLTAMLGSYTATTARAQFYEVLDLYDPAKVSEARAAFDKAADKIERYPSITFYTRMVGETPIKFTPTRIQVNAKKYRLVDGRESASDPVQFCIGYQVENAKFSITQITEKTFEEANNDVDACLRD